MDACLPQRLLANDRVRQLSPDWAVDVEIASRIAEVIGSSGDDRAILQRMLVKALFPDNVEVDHDTHEIPEIDTSPHRILAIRLHRDSMKKAAIDWPLGVAQAADHHTSSPKS